MIMAKKSNAAGKRKTRIALFFFLTLSIMSPLFLSIIETEIRTVPGLQDNLLSEDGPDKPHSHRKGKYYLLSCLSMPATKSSGLMSPA